jgi:hypothetical protein
VQAIRYIQAQHIIQFVQYLILQYLGRIRVYFYQNLPPKMGIVFTRNCYVPGIQRTDGTAMGVAKVRLTEDGLPENKKLFSDPYAREFVIGASVMGWMEPEQIVKKWDGVLAGMYPMLVGRTRWLDDLVRSSLKGERHSPRDFACSQVRTWIFHTIPQIGL